MPLASVSPNPSAKACSSAPAAAGVNPSIARWISSGSPLAPPLGHAAHTNTATSTRTPTPAAHRRQRPQCPSLWRPRDGPLPHRLRQRPLGLWRRREPVLRLLLQQPHHHRRQRHRNGLRQRRRRLVQDRVEPGRVVGALEGAAPRQRLVEHHAERPQIRARVGAALRLLGRGVEQRARGHARPGQVHTLDLSDAEVEDLGVQPVALTQEDVGRLEVAVDDAARVSRTQAAGDLAPERGDVLWRQRPPVEAVAERLAPVARHRHEGPPVVGLADLVDGADVRMVDAGRGPRFGEEPLAGLRVGATVVGQHLEGHLAVEPLVLRPVHDAHAALSQRAEHAVTADGVGGHGKVHVKRRVAEYSA